MFLSVIKLPFTVEITQLLLTAHHGQNSICLLSFQLTLTLNPKLNIEEICSKALKSLGFIQKISLAFDFLDFLRSSTLFVWMCFFGTLLLQIITDYTMSKVHRRFLRLALISSSNYLTNAYHILCILLNVYLDFSLPCLQINGLAFNCLLFMIYLIIIYSYCIDTIL